VMSDLGVKKKSTDSGAPAGVSLTRPHHG